MLKYFKILVNPLIYFELSLQGNKEKQVWAKSYYPDEPSKPNQTSEPKQNSLQVSLAMKMV